MSSRQHHAQEGAVLGARRTSVQASVVTVLSVALLFFISACSGGSGGSGSSNSGGSGSGSAVTLVGGLSSDGFMTITGVELSDAGEIDVTFALSDSGTPLALGDLDGDPRFHLAWIQSEASSGLTRYQSYIVNNRTGSTYELNGMTMQPAMASATQASRDSGGSFEDLGGGTFRYRFGTVLPAGYDADAIHTISVQVSKDGREVWGNPYVHFVPSGAAPGALRETVTTAACQSCHSNLGAHGGTRNEVTLCQACHTNQTFDPETGESLEFAEMVHKIHSAPLQSSPYIVVGFNNSVHDYSEVHYPQDTRNCDSCHAGGSVSDHWKEKPSRQACGACHGDVDFATGTGHGPGVQQLSDDSCTTCHGSTMVAEFDMSVPGAHVQPYTSSVNPNLTLAITDVQGLTPGTQPTISFTISDNSGPVDITTVNRVAIVFAGNTDDYTSLISTDNRFTIQGGGSVGLLTTVATGSYTWQAFRDAGNTDAYSIPMTATGTWAIGMESRTEAIAAGPDSIRFGANNPVVYVDVTDGTLGGGNPVAHRDIVDEAACDSCHKDLIIHGNLRTDLEYCGLCHNRWATDEGRRGGGTDPLGPLDPITNPPETVDFKMMIHKIHRGADLENGYAVWGFSSQLDFGNIHYPNALNDCTVCHLSGTHQLPLPAGVKPTVRNIAGTPLPALDAILPPISATCAGCHDSDSTMGHILTNLAPSPVTNHELYFESCETCHGPGAAYDADEAHK